MVGHRRGVQTLRNEGLSRPRIWSINHIFMWMWRSEVSYTEGAGWRCVITIWGKEASNRKSSVTEGFVTIIVHAFLAFLCR